MFKDLFLETYVGKPEDAMSDFFNGRQKPGETVEQFKANLVRYAEIAGLDLTELKKYNEIFVKGLDPERKKAFFLDHDADFIMRHLKAYDLLNEPMVGM